MSLMTCIIYFALAQIVFVTEDKFRHKTHFSPNFQKVSLSLSFFSVPGRSGNQHYIMILAIDLAYGKKVFNPLSNG